MNAHLFVYGSLMSTARHRMGERLRAEARLIGPATMQGRLYRVSWYPGVSESTDPEQRVHGELYALDTPSHALAWLDAYEGVAPGSRESGEYTRVERPVRLDFRGRGHSLGLSLLQGREPAPPRRRRALDGRFRLANAALHSGVPSALFAKQQSAWAIAGPEVGRKPVSSRYHEVYAAWKRDPQSFWAEAAREIDWYKPWDKVFDPTPANTAAGSQARSATRPGIASTGTWSAGAASRRR